MPNAINPQPFSISNVGGLRYTAFGSIFPNCSIRACLYPWVSHWRFVSSNFGFWICLDGADARALWLITLTLTKDFKDILYCTWFLGYYLAKPSHFQHVSAIAKGTSWKQGWSRAILAGVNVRIILLELLMCSVTWCCSSSAIRTASGWFNRLASLQLKTGHRALSEPKKAKGYKAQFCLHSSDTCKLSNCCRTRLGVYFVTNPYSGHLTATSSVSRKKQTATVTSFAWTFFFVCKCSDAECYRMLACPLNPHSWNNLIGFRSTPRLRRI